MAEGRRGPPAPEPEAEAEAPLFLPSVSFVRFVLAPPGPFRRSHLFAVTLAA
jgi:hypothetical protein